MIKVFLETLVPITTLFLIMMIGFALRKTKILPEESGKTMAKLETWVFCPALSLSTMIGNCTRSTISTHATNIVISLTVAALAIAIGVVLARIFVKTKSSERGIYCYSLVFANCGYIGDPVVKEILGEEMLSYYKLFCLPINILIMTWGISMLIPRDKGEKGSLLKSVLNPPMVALFIGVILGISGFGEIIPQFLSNLLSSLANCMGPVAMLLAGFTIAGYKTKDMISAKKVYLASLLRLTVLPAIMVAFAFLAKEIANVVFGMSIDNTVLSLVFFAFAMPLGMNTIVFPEAYGGNPKTGASMVLVSSAMGVLTIPLMYSLLNLIF